jgi:hypothetical protein
VPSGVFFRLLRPGQTASPATPRFRLRGYLDGTVYVDQEQAQTKQLYATALYNDGIALAQQGKKGGALSALRESLALGPPNPAQARAALQQVEAMSPTAGK